MTAVVRRDDELGHLMQAVNRMAADLDEREKQIEVDSQRHAHHDKMLAVGALAAGIAHEVNNPLAVISGAAQELRAASGALSPQALEDGTRLILAQADRAARAARQLADITAPAEAADDWIDINAMLRRVTQLTGYDKRYRQIRIDLALDSALPAVRSTGSLVQQVLMQMLAIACDALVDSKWSPAALVVATVPGGREISIELRMPPALDFQRAEVQRALLLCRAIIEPLRGRLAFGQGLGEQLTFKLTLPAESGRNEG
jgi:two-component system, NtrC family, sensor kinase